MEPVVGNIVGFGEVTMEVDSSEEQNRYMITHTHFHSLCMYVYTWTNETKFDKF